ncbi:hypothetical protein T484DRAFT_1742896 [Baffinella frigidus]|nr:hypothetical protein T484DRAFT_1742896 [Cryptophyta sp. CCMP2293]
MPWRHLIFPTAAGQEVFFPEAPNQLSTFSAEAAKEQEQERDLLEAVAFQDWGLIDAAFSATTSVSSDVAFLAPIMTPWCPADQDALVSPAPNLAAKDGLVSPAKFAAKKKQAQELDRCLIDDASCATTPTFASLPRSEEHTAELPGETTASAAHRTTEWLQRTAREFGSMFPMSVAKRESSPAPSPRSDQDFGFLDF